MNRIGQFLRHNFIRLIVGIVLLAVVVFLVVATIQTARVPSYLRAIYPTSTIAATLQGDRFTVNSSTVYTKKIEVNSSTLFLVVENYQNQGSIYRFYSSSTPLRLLKEVGSFIAPENSQQVFENNFFTKDITGDGIAELFVKLQTSGNNMSSWEIINWGDGSLVNDLSESASFDDISYKDGFIAMTWHDVDVRGETRYKQTAVSVLTPIRSIAAFADNNNPGDCNIEKMEGNETQYSVIDHIKNCDIWTQSLDAYWGILPQNTDPFDEDLALALSDPKYAALATVFKQSCPIGSMTGTGSIMDPGSSTFRGFIDSAKLVKNNPDGSFVIILPCDQGAYQGSFVAALYNGKTYIPLAIPEINEDGSTSTSYGDVNLGYDPTTDLFGTSALLRGMGGCGTSATYKLVGQQLVMQKFVADWNCDDPDNWQVIYDINKTSSSN